jgi:hypothetical protein
MRLYRTFQAILVLVCALSLTACGLMVPDMAEVWDRTDPDATQHMEAQIKKAIYCELRDAVKNVKKDESVVHYFHMKQVKQQDDAALPDSWGAQVTFSLEVDEKTAISPGVSLKTPMHAGATNFQGELIGATGLLSAVTYPFVSTAQSYAFGLGGTLSSQTQRTDKFNSYYSVAYLNKTYGEKGICNDPPDLGPPSTSSPFLVISKLGIKDWLSNSVYVDNILASSSGGGGDSSFKSDSISYEIKFIVVSDGNLSPSWNLVRVSANAGNTPLFDMSRTRTHDLLITIGPGKTETQTASNGKQVQKTVPSQSTANSHLAAEIGLAVANAIRNNP